MFQTALPTHYFISGQIMSLFISLIDYIMDKIIFHGKSYYNITVSVYYQHRVISWEIEHY